MRKQINGLALLVQEQMELSPFEHPQPHDVRTPPDRTPRRNPPELTPYTRLGVRTGRT